MMGSKIERFALALKGPTLVTDGACNLCTGAISFISTRLAQGQKLYFLWAQHPDTLELLSALGLTQADLMTSWALLKDGQVYRGSDAWIEVGLFLVQPWKFLFSVASLVPHFLRETVYRFIAQHRYRLFGGTDSCQRPDKSRAQLFLHAID